jgi:hypothetical protein
LRDISAIAPEGTASVRVTAGASGMFVPPNPDGLPQGGFFDDLSLAIAVPGFDGDHNKDGVVDAADFVAWSKNPDGFGGNPDGYDAWVEDFGSGNAGSGGDNLRTAVPEPSCLLLLFAALVGGALCHRQWSAVR